MTLESAFVSSPIPLSSLLGFDCLQCLRHRLHILSFIAAFYTAMGLPVLMMSSPRQNSDVLLHPNRQ
jgi:hypothetical protein